MSSPFMTEDDLDEGFNPDQDVLDTPVQKTKADTDTVIVTKAENTPKPEIPKGQEGPSMNDLLSSKLVLIQNQQAKVTQVQDVHDVITATESIDRQHAELIGCACEDFFGPRLRVTEFSQTPSKLNYNYSKTFLDKKISTESAKLAEAIRTFATEDVMQYASFITSEKESVAGTMNVSDKLEVAVSKGIFVEADKTMVDISTYSLDKLEEAIGNSGASSDLRDAISEFCEVITGSKAVAFVAARISGMSVYDAIGSAGCTTTKAVPTVQEILTYVNDKYVTDSSALQDELKYGRTHKDNMMEKLDESIEDPCAFINVAKDILINFRRFETIEEISTVMQMSVKVINRIIEAAKF